MLLPIALFQLRSFHKEVVSVDPQTTRKQPRNNSNNNDISDYNAVVDQTHGILCTVIIRPLL